MSANDLLNLVFCAMDGLTVALPAAAVRGLDVAEGDLASRDLAEVLGIAITGVRRRLRVHGDPDFDLIVGGALSVEEVGPGEVQALPGLIAGLAGGGLLGVIHREDGFVLVFEPRKLAPEVPRG